MERLGKPRHGREGRRLSERDVSQSNLVALALGRFAGWKAWPRPERFRGCVAASTPLRFAQNDKLLR
jgi:hypothetical protein